MWKGRIMTSAALFSILNKLYKGIDKINRLNNKQTKKRIIVAAITSFVLKTKFFFIKHPSKNAKKKR